MLRSLRGAPERVSVTRQALLLLPSRENAESQETGHEKSSRRRFRHSPNDAEIREDNAVEAVAVVGAGIAVDKGQRRRVPSCDERVCELLPVERGCTGSGVCIAEGWPTADRDIDCTGRTEDPAARRVADEIRQLVGVSRDRRHTLSNTFGQIVVEPCEIEPLGASAGWERDTILSERSADDADDAARRADNGPAREQRWTDRKVHEIRGHHRRLEASVGHVGTRDRRWREEQPDGTGETDSRTEQFEHARPPAIGMVWGAA